MPARHRIDTWTASRLRATSNELGSRRSINGPLPRPPAFDLQDQGPAQERADDDEAAEHGKAHQRRRRGDRLYDVGRDHDLEPQQQRAADADLAGLVLRLAHALAHVGGGGPHQPRDDDGRRRHLDGEADDP
jgi:hypothetical protein